MNFLQENVNLLKLKARNSEKYALFTDREMAYSCIYAICTKKPKLPKHILCWNVGFIQIACQVNSYNSKFSEFLCVILECHMVRKPWKKMGMCRDLYNKKFALEENMEEVEEPINSSDQEIYHLV